MEGPDLLGLFDSLIAQLQDGKRALELQKSASYAAGDAAGYARGLAEGQAMHQEPEKEFSADDVEKIKDIVKAEARAEMQIEIDALNIRLELSAQEIKALAAHVDELEDALTNAEADKQNAVKERTALLIGKFKQAEVDNQAIIAEYDEREA